MNNSSILNENFDKPGDQSLHKLWAYEFIHKEDMIIDGLDMPSSTKTFLKQHQHHDMSAFPLQCEKVVTISNNKGCIRYPSPNDDSWPCEPSHDYWGSHQHLPGEDIESVVCRGCVNTGKWGIDFSGRSEKLICIRGCSECVRKCGFIWGHYKSTNDQTVSMDRIPWIPIPNNGVQLVPENNEEGDLLRTRSIELSNQDMIETTLKKLWNYRCDYDPPHWRDFFIRVPERITKLIFEMFGFSGHINCVGDIPIDSLAQSKVNGIFEKLNKQENIYDNLLDDILEITESEYDMFDEIEDIEEIEEIEETIKRKENVKNALQVIEGIMDTDGQKMDQGKYLELCNLLRDIHQE